MEKLFGMFPWRPDKPYKGRKAMEELDASEERKGREVDELEKARLKMLGVVEEPDQQERRH